MSIIRGFTPTHDPVFRFHYRVRAFKVASIDKNTLRDMGEMSAAVSDDFMERFSPTVGDYYALWENGVENMIPAAEFETRYKRL